MSKTLDIINAAMAEGGLLDALLNIQKEYGYVSEAAIYELAECVGVSAAEMFDTASFYSMLRFEKPAKVEVRLCRGTACHSAGNAALAAALECATGMKMGQKNDEYDIGWVECLGQCQSAPNVLVNGKLYSGVDPEMLVKLIGKGGAH